MNVYGILVAFEAQNVLEELFRLKVLNGHLRERYRRYRYFRNLEAHIKETSHYHLILDTAIYFDVSEQTIYKDVRIMEKKVNICDIQGR